MSEPHGQEPDGWPCAVSEEVDALLADLSLPGEVFGAIIAATVQINETLGMVPGSTASAKRPQQRRMPLGQDRYSASPSTSSLPTPTCQTRPEDRRHHRPALPPDEWVRIVTGAQAACTPDALTAREIPLRAAGAPEELAGAETVLGLLRALLTGTQVFSSGRVDYAVMGMPLVHVDPAMVAPVTPGMVDNTFTILHTLTCPWIEEQPSPRLRGFVLHALTDCACTWTARKPPT